MDLELSLRVIYFIYFFVHINIFFNILARFDCLLVLATLFLFPVCRELHRQKPAPTVHYQRNMPDIEPLMQEWPAEFEELLNQVITESCYRVHTGPGNPALEFKCSIFQDWKVLKNT